VAGRLSVTRDAVRPVWNEGPRLPVAASLILLKDKNPVSEYAISRERPLIVGRASDAIVHVRDPKLSRHHCEVGWTQDGYYVRDLNSKNGTFMNGARITRARLRDGDRVQIGLTRFVFRGEPAGSSDETLVAPPRLCAACGKIVAIDDMGTARQTQDRIYCSTCIDITPLLGRTVGGYEIIQLLGRGAMGTVFKAEQLSMSRPVALKVLHRELTAADDAVRRFLREARAGGQFSHPNIIRIYDMNVAEGHYFISMEFIAGGDLGALLEREGPLPVAQALDIALQTGSALAHAHGKGVIHRDIKPSNLLLGRDDLIKVADLGLAKSLDVSGVSALTGAGAALGTLAYVPPEQITDASSVDQRADIYSLGATAYHLLSGERPFRGRTVTEVATAVRTEQPRPLRAYRDDVPVVFDQIILRAMAKQPGQRYATAAEMLEALKTVRL